MPRPSPIEPDPRWDAVLTRNAGFDGTFVYAVKTSGVFCRPSCPSRRGKSENVAFYATGDEAAQAGFRACKRCGPR
jgi:AraC family transcriptional regulator, regulatory protein of adaptative response / methylated-DNA-[protein]-cysteine methyltransferase